MALGTTADSYEKAHFLMLNTSDVRAILKTHQSTVAIVLLDILICHQNVIVLHTTLSGFVVHAPG